jgi:hypothetical protein
VDNAKNSKAKLFIGTGRAMRFTDNGSALDIEINFRISGEKGKEERENFSRINSKLSGIVQKLLSH